MIVLLSPSKRMPPQQKLSIQNFTLPRSLDKTEYLVKKLQKLPLEGLQKLLGVNSKLSRQNFERFMQWSNEFNVNNAMPAMFSYSGDVYAGLAAASFNQSDLNFAQGHLRIISALYGLLRPLDLIKPYRLEMGQKFDTGKSKNLYEFWQNQLDTLLDTDLSGTNPQIVVNLASAEYSHAFDFPRLQDVKIISPDFREYKNGKYSFINVLGKKARGLMARYIILNKVTKPGELKLFDLEGYEYNEGLSIENRPVFTRG